MVFLRWAIRFISLASFGLMFQSSLAQNSGIPGVTLEDFFNAAINFSPDLRIAEENLNISSARKRAANGQLLPQVSAGGSLSDNRLNQLNRSQTFDGQRYYLGLTQTLFNWQQFAARKQAHLEEDQSEEQYYYELASLLSDVANRYFDVLREGDEFVLISVREGILKNFSNTFLKLFERLTIF